MPGKVPLYLETASLAIGAESETTVGLEISDGSKTLFYIPGCAEVTPKVQERLRNADLLFFDGTTFTDDEMVALGLSNKTAWRMGHVAMTGEKGSLVRLSDIGIRRKIFVHINNTNPVLIEDSPERAKAAAAGWKFLTMGWRLVYEPDAFKPRGFGGGAAQCRRRALSQQASFHARQYSGKCSFEEIQAWALNRYYYQSMIPIKDAIVLTRFTDAEDRRQWRKRIEDHDGLKPGDGGIERWLKLTDSLGFPRDYVESTAGILPATRFAVDAYVTLVRDRSPLEAVASSLTRIVFAEHHRRTHVGHAGELRLRQQGHAGLFLLSADAGQARRRLGTRLRQVARDDRGAAAGRHQPRSSSSAMCSGRSSMRCGAPMSIITCRRMPGFPARSRPRAAKRHSETI